MPAPPAIDANTAPSAIDANSTYANHDVTNQPGALHDVNLFANDRPLVEATKTFGAAWAAPHLVQAGAITGSERVQFLARQANRHLPELKTHDRFGHRTDTVEFHPAYHELMALIFGTETHSFAWTNPRPGAHVARAVLSYLWNQAENGICCPMGMTFASIPALKHDQALHDQWAPLVNSVDYDPTPTHAAAKKGATVGMAMTEKQGGSDLRATITTARPATSRPATSRPATSRRGSSAPYLLTGHKWFFSVPMSDLFLTLAQTETGLSCFLAAGWLPDGSRNRLKLQRLKDKCGNKSNASSEVEFHDLEATMLGEEGRGIRTIIEMAHATRLDFAVGSAGLMRQATSQAIHHTSNRRAFQKSLVDLPIMQNVVADLALESEAMMWLSLRLASALDRSETDPREALLSRIATPVAKYWSCKRAPAVVAEALECHGGNGFIADHLMERLYREAPLNGIWEGTGNVICLDVLRAMKREPETVDVFLDEIGQTRGADPRLDAYARTLADRLRHPEALEPVARQIVERMAFALQASLLLRHAPNAVSEAFCATRLDGDWGHAFGTMPNGLDTASIIKRAALT